jgi:DNA-binding protein HU-beta
MMNKTEVITKIAKVAGLSKIEAEKALNAFVRVDTDTLKEGEEIRVLGFGKFCITKRAATTGHNPKTGVPIKIPAKILPRFKAG